MANKLKDLYPTQVDIDANNPDGTFKNDLIPGDKQGTPLDKGWQRDLWGFVSHLLNKANIAPDGSEENINDSQIYESLAALFFKQGLDINMLGQEILNSKTISEMQRGKAYSLDGESGTYINVSDDVNLNSGTDDLSILIFAKLDPNNPGVVYLYAKGNGSTEFITLRHFLGKLQFGLLGTGGSLTTIDSDNSLYDGEMHGIVVRGDRDGNMTMCIDGILQTSTAACPTENLDNATSLILGALTASVQNADCELYGVKLWNRHLSDDETKAYASNPLKVLEDKDIGGSQVAQNVSTCVNASYDSFSGASATGFTAEKTTTGGGNQSGGTADEIVIIKGKQYLVSFDLVLNSGSLPSYNLGLTLTGAGVTNDGLQTAQSGKNRYVFTANTNTTGVLQMIVTSLDVSNYTVSNLKISRAGCIAEWTPWNAKNDFWFESQNDNHGSVNGATVINDKSVGDSENSWIPTVSFSGGNGDLTYDSQIGHYKLEAGYAEVWGTVQFDQTSANGNLTVNLPFMSKNIASLNYPSSVVVQKIGASGNVVGGFLEHDSSELSVLKIPQGSAAGLSFITAADCSTTDCQINFYVKYPIEG